MTILKHILPILGIATFIHAQDAADSNQDFPVEESMVPVDEETEAPTIVDVAPTPTAKKSKAKAKQQEPQQVYISNELDYVPVSKSVMQLTLREDDPADAPDPRDGDDTPKKKEVQTSGGLFGFGFLADDSDAAVSGESGSSKNSSFKLGLHAGLGYLSIGYYVDDEPHAGEYELGAVVTLKNIVADMFVSTGFYCIGSWRKENISRYDRDVIHEEYGVIAGVPITVGYQFMNMFNIQVGTQLSLPVFALGFDDDWDDSNAKWFPGGGSASITLGASAVLGQSHEIGFKVDFAKDYILYALTYNYWLF